MADIRKFDWEKVGDALAALLEHSLANEEHAVNFHSAIETVLAGLPENGED